MTGTQDASREIVVDQEFPHRPEVIWRVLTDAALLARWLMAAPQGFAPVVGRQFTLVTAPAGQWDGLIRCEVLEAVPHALLVYSWRSGHESNVGYGAPLDTIVRWRWNRGEWAPGCVSRIPALFCRAMKRPLPA